MGFPRRPAPPAAPATSSRAASQCLVDGGGADVNAVDNNGMQPVDLAMASVTNREAVLEVLRAADAPRRWPCSPRPRDAERCGRVKPGRFIRLLLPTVPAAPTRWRPLLV